MDIQSEIRLIQTGPESQSSMQYSPVNPSHLMILMPWKLDEPVTCLFQHQHYFSRINKISGR